MRVCCGAVSQFNTPILKVTSSRSGSLSPPCCETNAAVASMPQIPRIFCRPPGCLSIHGVRSYTFPRIIVQQLFASCCIATSLAPYIVWVFGVLVAADAVVFVELFVFSVCTTNKSNKTAISAAKTTSLVDIFSVK